MTSNVIAVIPRRMRFGPAPAAQNLNEICPGDDHG
jgi:hypothetical protein